MTVAGPGHLVSRPPICRHTLTRTELKLTAVFRRLFLYSFSGGDGAYPNAGLIADANGDLFGTTYTGGAYGRGTVFELVKTASGYTENVLYSFSGISPRTDGASPVAGLIADANGDLFGTTYTGGANGDGTVFEITNSGFVPFAPLVSPDFTHVTFGQQDVVPAPGVLANDQPAATCPKCGKRCRASMLTSWSSRRLLTISPRRAKKMK